MPKGVKGKPLATACLHTDRPHYCKGMCLSCYSTLTSRNYYRRTHPNSTPRGVTPAIDRFEAKVRVLANGCWEWTGSHKPKSQGSYPMFTPSRTEPKKKAIPMHAVAWAYENIRDLEAPKRGSGLELSHQPDRCKLMSRCCNPAHVEPETHQQNSSRISKRVVKRVCAIARKGIKNPVYFPKKTHCLRGHARTPDNLTTEARCKTCVRHKVNQRSWLNAVNRAVKAA